MKSLKSIVVFSLTDVESELAAKFKRLASSDDGTTTDRGDPPTPTSAGATTFQTRNENQAPGDVYQNYPPTVDQSSRTRNIVKSPAVSDADFKPAAQSSKSTRPSAVPVTPTKKQPEPPRPPTVKPKTPSQSPSSWSQIPSRSSGSSAESTSPPATLSTSSTTFGARSSLVRQRSEPVFQQPLAPTGKKPVSPLSTVDPRPVNKGGSLPPPLPTSMTTAAIGNPRRNATPSQSSTPMTRSASALQHRISPEHLSPEPSPPRPVSTG